MIKSISAVALAASLCASAAHGATVTETFNGSLGGFNSAVGNTAGGNSFGYSSTSNAGGTTGELGGTFARTTPDAYVANTDLGGTVGGTQAFSFSGRGYLDDVSFDGSIMVGYFTPVAGSDVVNFTGIEFAEPSTVGGQFRVNFQNGGTRQNVTTSAGSVGIFTLAPNATGFDLSVAYDGAGQFSGSVNGVAFTYAGTAPSNLSAFGVATGNVGSSNSSQTATAYFDNLTYTVVPEPASVALLGLGGLACLARRRQA